MKLQKVIPLFAGILIGAGAPISLLAESDSNKRDLLSKEELTKKYDRNGDGQLDYREKMAFLRTLNEEEKAAYRKHFTGLSQDNSGQNDGREHGERGHNDGEHGERHHNARERGESRGWFAGGPSSRLIERWKNRREALYRKKDNPSARSGYRGSHGPIGPSARSGYRGSRGPIGPSARSGYRGSRGPIGPSARSSYRGSRGPIGPSARSGYRGFRGPRSTQDRGWKRNRSQHEVRRGGRGSVGSKRSQAQVWKRDRSRGNTQPKHKNRRGNRR